MTNDELFRPDAEPELPSGSDLPTKIVSTLDLFQGQREICIEHDGERYKLRITRRGKLILQK